MPLLAAVPSHRTSCLSSRQTHRLAQMSNGKASRWHSPIQMRQARLSRRNLRHLHHRPKPPTLLDRPLLRLSDRREGRPLLSRATRAAVQFSRFCYIRTNLYLRLLPVQSQVCLQSRLHGCTEFCQMAEGSTLCLAIATTHSWGAQLVVVNGSSRASWTRAYGSHHVGRGMMCRIVNFCHRHPCAETRLCATLPCERSVVATVDA
jgi:hypothetical protein